MENHWIDVSFYLFFGPFSQHFWSLFSMNKMKLLALLPIRPLYKSIWHQTSTYQTLISDSIFWSSFPSAFRNPLSRHLDVDAFHSQSSPQLACASFMISQLRLCRFARCFSKGRQTCAVVFLRVGGVGSLASIWWVLGGSERLLSIFWMRLGWSFSRFGFADGCRSDITEFTYLSAL